MSASEFDVCWITRTHSPYEKCPTTVSSGESTERAKSAPIVPKEANSDNESRNQLLSYSFSKPNFTCFRVYDPSGLCLLSILFNSFHSHEQLIQTIHSHCIHLANQISPLSLYTTLTTPPNTCLELTLRLESHNVNMSSQILTHTALVLNKYASVLSLFDFRIVLTDS
jgi:hypothetical protein